MCKKDWFTQGQSHIIYSGCYISICQGDASTWLGNDYNTASGVRGFTVYNL